MEEKDNDGDNIFELWINWWTNSWVNTEYSPKEQLEDFKRILLKILWD